VASKQTWGALFVVIAGVGGTIFALRSSKTDDGAPPSPTTSTNTTASDAFVPPAWLTDAKPPTDLVPSVPLDPARPDAEPPKVTSKECPPGYDLFDDKTPQGQVHGCGMLDPDTKQVLREGFWSIVENTGNRLDGRYVDGKREGEWILWSPAGRALQSWQYKEGRYDGWQIEWNEAGQKVIERHFKEGALDGDVYYTQPDGTRTHEVWKEGRKIEPADPPPPSSSSSTSH
jgi:hypothetical protein